MSMLQCNFMLQCFSDMHMITITTDVALPYIMYTDIYVTHRMRNMRGGSHAVHFDVASTTMLMGTNQKAWQSGGSSTVRE